MFGASPGDGEHYELFKHFTGWRMLPENGLKDVRELLWSMAGDKSKPIDASMPCTP
jgi:hypothetical protein